MARYKVREGVHVDLSSGKSFVKGATFEDDNEELHKLFKNKLVKLGASEEEVHEDKVESMGGQKRSEDGAFPMVKKPEKSKSAETAGKSNK